MWSRAPLLFPLLAGACASNDVTHDEYKVWPKGPGEYSVRLTGRAPSIDNLKAELAKRAAKTCGGEYKLTDQDQMITICSDGCNPPLALIAKLHCGAAA